MRQLVLRGFLALVVLGAFAAPSQPARAADPVQVVTARSTFLPGDDEVGAPTLVVPAGVGITVTNLDAFAAHGLTSDVVLPNGERLFESGVLNFRGAAPVSGASSLPPGTYGFHCSVHEDNMHGTLVVR